jgi:hypothetical protein
VHLGVQSWKDSTTILQFFGGWVKAEPFRFNRRKASDQVRFLMDSAQIVGRRLADDEIPFGQSDRFRFRLCRLLLCFAFRLFRIIRKV